VLPTQPLVTSRRAPARLLLSMFIALLALPMTAHANAPYALDGPELRRALSVADAHWGSRPCAGQIAMSWVDDPDPGLNAISYWAATTPYNTSCSVTFNVNAEWDEAKFCTIVVHELGHLHGRPHVDDPHDLMAEIYDRPFAGCTAAGAAPSAVRSPDRLNDASARHASSRVTSRGCGRKPKGKAAQRRHHRCLARRAHRSR
jgi:hypothetical protein